jgi:type I restriction enzyme S subunit
MPPLAEQRRIAGVLGALDDLIETNHRLIDRLLGLANAVFLDRFGSRPLGLTVGEIGAVVDCLHSKKPDRVDDGRLYLQLNNILDNGMFSTSSTYLIEDADYAKWTRNLETSAWDCVITNVGRVGAVARIPDGVRAALGRNMTAIRPVDSDVDGAFLLAALLSPPVRREIDFKTDSGTILSALNVRSIAGLRLPSADRDERCEFHQMASPLLLQADALMAENETIERTRAELLPLLLSGRVSVREVAA